MSPASGKLWEEPQWLTGLTDGQARGQVSREPAHARWTPILACNPERQETPRGLASYSSQDQQAENLRRDLASASRVESDWESWPTSTAGCLKHVHTCTRAPIHAHTYMYTRMHAMHTHRLEEEEEEER